MKQVKKFILFIAVVTAAVGWLLPSQASAWGRGHLYVIGTGPAGPRMATLQALDTIKRMDAIAASDQRAKLFAEYIGDKPVLFDPWEGLWGPKGKSYLDERVKQIKSLLDKGKDVGLLDSGNPCLFGPSHWYVEEFEPQELAIIPGMGCDAAAMAALGKSVIPAHDTRFVIQTAPMFLMDKKMKDIQVLKDLGKYPATMIQYMALGNPEKLFATLEKVYPLDMPCAVVYWAGDPDRQRIVKGTVADMGQKLAKEKENFMGLLLIGRFLEGKPYKEAMKKRSQSK